MLYIASITFLSVDFTPIFMEKLCKNLNRNRKYSGTQRPLSHCTYRFVYPIRLSSTSLAHSLP